jgi:hypothetical protein
LSENKWLTIIQNAGKMSVKEWGSKGHLVLDLAPSYDLDAIVRSSFQSLRYVEAFTLLHSWIDCMLWDLEGDEPTKFKTQFGNIRFKRSLEHIQKAKIITKEEARELNHFNKRRDLIVHRLMFRTLADIDPEENFPELQITKKEAKKSLEDGLFLATMLKQRLAIVKSIPHNRRKRPTSRYLTAPPVPQIEHNPKKYNEPTRNS